MKLSSLPITNALAALALWASFVSLNVSNRMSKLLQLKTNADVQAQSDWIYQPDEFAILKGSLNRDNELEARIHDLEQTLKYYEGIEIERLQNTIPTEFRDIPASTQEVWSTPSKMSFKTAAPSYMPPIHRPAGKFPKF